TSHLSNAPSSEKRNTEVKKAVPSVQPISPSLINGISSISSGGFVPEDVTTLTLLLQAALSGTGQSRKQTNYLKPTEVSMNEIMLDQKHRTCNIHGKW
ncbi:hypothetical protein FGIG_06492, partial [Fasciola gigantica]